jgi:PAS domain S-box-containing protein
MTDDAPLFAAHTAVLEAIADGAPIEATLEKVVALVALHLPTAMPAILLRTEGDRLRVAVRGDVPLRFAEACEGLRIGPTFGSCGAAVFSGEPVVTADVESDPRWEAFRELAREVGIRSCWSIPIRVRRAGSSILAYGSLSVYRREPGGPDAEALTILARAEHLASVAIQSDSTLRELRESEARFRIFVEHAFDGFFVHAEDARIVDVNRRACEALGYTREELLGRDPTFFDPDTTLERVQETLRTVGARNEPYALETRHRRKDGVIFPVEVRVQSFVVDGVRRYLALVRDVSERQRHERELRRAAEELRFAQELANLGNWTYDVAKDAATGSDVAWRIYGLEPGVRPISAIFKHIHPEDRARVELAWKAALAGGSYDIEHRIVVGDQVKWIHVRAAISSEGSTPRFVDGVTQDVTARHRLEEQLRQAQKMEAIGQLAGGVAHDFNNLLTVINGFSEVLLEQAAPGTSMRDDLTAIRDAGARAEALTSQLLAFSRRSIIELRTLQLNDVIQRLTRLLQRLIGENIRVSTVLDRNLSPIDADPGQVEQVIMNLVVNARDAMPAGGRLTITTQDVVLDGHDAVELAPGRYVELSVRDTGEGIAEGVRERIFEPFFTTKGPGRGTGLGLSTVYGIAKQSGGDVRVESAIGEGSTFYVRFPASAHDHDVAVTRGSIAPPGTESVLLVEDEEGVRRLAARALRLFGYDVIDAPDGASALALVRGRGRPIDALVTDVVMPGGMSGRDLALAMKRENPSLKVLYVSGYTDDAVLRHGVSLSLDAFLQKPFTPGQLASKLREVLDHE